MPTVFDMETAEAALHTGGCCGLRGPADPHRQLAAILPLT
jgi:hypothetical protein